MAGVKKPNPFEAAFSKLLGFLVGLGLAPSHFYLLQVRGRKTGRIYSTPVDVLHHAGRRFLVSPRGFTQWSRNAAVSGTVTLKRGRMVEQLLVRHVAAAEKPEILKAYLDAFRKEVQRFFPVAAGSAADALAPLAARYPAFELLRPPTP